MDPIVEQILKVSKEISISSKRGKANFVWTTEETLGDIQDCLDRSEHKKHMAEIEKKLNRSIKNATK
jgi:hypothetical protein